MNSHLLVYETLANDNLIDIDIYNVILPAIGIQIIQFTIYFVDLEPISSSPIVILSLWLTLFYYYGVAENSQQNMDLSEHSSFVICEY